MNRGPKFRVTYIAANGRRKSHTMQSFMPFDWRCNPDLILRCALLHRDPTGASRPARVYCELCTSDSHIRTTGYTWDPLLADGALHTLDRSYITVGGYHG